MGFLAIGTTAFTVLTIATLILLFWFVNIAREFEGSGKLAITLLVIYTALNILFGNKEVVFGFFGDIFHSPAKIIAGLVVYIGIGLVWSFVRWYFYLIDTRDEQIRDRKRYPVTHSGPLRAPLAIDHKGDIIFWMSYWPLNSVWSLFRHPLRRAFQWCYERFGKMYDRLSAKVFGDANAEFEESTKKKETTH